MAALPHLPVRTPAALLLPLLALTSVVASAQEEATPTVRGAEVDRGERHVLHLRAGPVLRVRARRTDEGWEILREGAWIALGPEAVLRAAPEAELERRARELGREVRGADAVRRVAYADWLVSVGLHVEALQALDRVLGEDPDQTEALALIERADFAVALPTLDRDDPESLVAYLAKVSRSSATVREIAVGRLAGGPDEDAEQEGLVAVLRAELAHASPRRRALAAHAFRRLLPGRELRELLSRAILDSSADVRREAAHALRDAEEEALVVPALRALGSRYPEVRKNAVDALGAMSYSAAVEPLYLHLVALQSSGGTRPPHAHIFLGRQIAYIQDFDVEVAQGESIADPVINVLQEGSVLDAAVIGATSYVARAEGAAVQRSLARLTGANPGRRVADWTRWWNEHGDEWTAGARPPGPPSSPESPGS